MELKLLHWRLININISITAVFPFFRGKWAEKCLSWLLECFSKINICILFGKITFFQFKKFHLRITCLPLGYIQHYSKNTFSIIFVEISIKARIGVLIYNESYLLTSAVDSSELAGGSWHFFFSTKNMK